MKDLHWEEMPLADRMEVYEVYKQILFEKEGWEISFEECDYGWTGSRWITIKYTFGIVY